MRGGGKRAVCKFMRCLLFKKLLKRIYNSRSRLNICARIAYIFFIDNFCRVFILPCVLKSLQRRFVKKNVAPLFKRKISRYERA